MWSPQIGHSRVSARLARRKVAGVWFDEYQRAAEVVSGVEKGRTSLHTRCAGCDRGCRRNNAVCIRVASTLRISS